MIAGSILLLAILVLSACHSRPKKVGQMDILTPREQLPVLATDSVTTLISDSGITRYRIESPRWLFFDKTDTPYQEFPKGIYLEQFDEQFHVEGYIQADTAWYYDQQKLWELRGRVLIRNVNGLVFRSEEFFWDGIRHEFYSYKFSRVVTPERTLEGTYFRSDEHMTHYEVTNSVGSFQSTDMEGDQDQSASKSSSAAPADSAAPAPPVRQAATRHKAAQKSVYQP